MRKVRFLSCAGIVSRLTFFLGVFRECCFCFSWCDELPQDGCVWYLRCRLCVSSLSCGFLPCFPPAMFALTDLTRFFRSLMRVVFSQLSGPSLLFGARLFSLQARCQPNVSAKIIDRSGPVCLFFPTRLQKDLPRPDYRNQIFP